MGFHHDGSEGMGISSWWFFSLGINGDFSWWYEVPLEYWFNIDGIVHWIFQLFWCTLNNIKSIICDLLEYSNYSNYSSGILICHDSNEDSMVPSYMEDAIDALDIEPTEPFGFHHLFLSDSMVIYETLVIDLSEKSEMWRVSFLFWVMWMTGPDSGHEKGDICVGLWWRTAMNPHIFRLPRHTPFWGVSLFTFRFSKVRNAMKCSWHVSFPFAVYIKYWAMIVASKADHHVMSLRLKHIYIYTYNYIYTYIHIYIYIYISWTNITWTTSKFLLMPWHSCARCPIGEDHRRDFYPKGSISWWWVPLMKHDGTKM